jgi:2-phosphosulfolactate phosphatase
VQGDPWEQLGFGVRFEWGPVGAAHLGAAQGALVIVDVLSFTTSVTIVVGRGGIVYPAAKQDADAVRLARERQAVLAIGRHAVTADHPWSLSPAALLMAPALPRLVLPSPNGSAIAAAAKGVVTAACLWNARAVGTWLGQRYGDREAPVTVIAAGERWPDGSLRPAVEDLIGAGAVIAAVAGVRPESGLSPEAAAARAVYEATPSVPEAIRGCASAVELTADGFAEDVAAAVRVDVSDVVPVLVDGAFRTRSDRAGLPVAGELRPGQHGGDEGH